MFNDIRQLTRGWVMDRLAPDPSNKVLSEGCRELKVARPYLYMSVTSFCANAWIRSYGHMDGNLLTGIDSSTCAPQWTAKTLYWLKPIWVNNSCFMMCSQNSDHPLTEHLEQLLHPQRSFSRSVYMLTRSRLTEVGGVCFCLCCFSVQVCLTEGIS